MDCNTIGGRIKSLREKRGETQAEVAEAMHVKRQTVDQWENGTRDLKTQHTIELANYFSITCDELLRGLKPENVDINRDLGLTDSAIEALKTYNLEHRNMFDEPVMKTINLLIENESTYQVFQAISTYLAKLSGPKNQTNPDLSYFEVLDESTGIHHRLPFEFLNDMYLVILQTQLSKLKADVNREVTRNGER